MADNNFFIPGTIKNDAAPFKTPSAKAAIDADNKANGLYEAYADAEAKSVGLKNEIEAQFSPKIDGVPNPMGNVMNAYIANYNGDEEAAKEDRESELEEAEKNATEARKKYEDAAEDAEKLKMFLLVSFSYRSSNANSQLAICPPFLCGDNSGLCFNKDIGNKALYGFAETGAVNPKSTVTFQEIMNTIPGVKIREYQVDYSIDLIINLFLKFAEGFNAAQNISISSDNVKSVGIFEYAKNALKEVKDKLGDMWDSFINGDVWATIVDGVTSLNKNEPDGNGLDKIDKKLAVVTVPYLFYYKLMSYTTTGIYEVPYNGLLLYKTDGATGWNTGHINVGHFFDGASGIFSKLAGNFLSHIAINKSPYWRPDIKTILPAQYEINFQLFNSSLHAAINNFLFIHKLIPGNMQIQYGMLTQSPCLYDIKIDGGIRHLCCTGSFEVNYKGSLRSVPSVFLEELNNYKGWFDIKGAGNAQKLIKIPDVYEVKLVFSSLLPNNYNNYLLGFSNPDLYKFVHVDGAYNDIMEKAGEFTRNLLPETKVARKETSTDYLKKPVVSEIDKATSDVRNKVESGLRLNATDSSIIAASHDEDLALAAVSQNKMDLYQQMANPDYTNNP